MPKKRDSKPLLLFLPVFLALLAGCGDHTLSPRPLAKGATLKLHVVSRSEFADTIEAVEGTGTIFLVDPAILTATDIASVQLSKTQPEYPSLIVTPTPAGSQKLSKATANPVGMRLALVANGSVVGTADLNNTLTSGLIFSSEVTMSNGDNLFDTLTLAR